jgi:hypothetical protein
MDALIIDELINAISRRSINNAVCSVCAQAAYNIAATNAFTVRNMSSLAQSPKHIVDAQTGSQRISANSTSSMTRVPQRAITSQRRS